MTIRKNVVAHRTKRGANRLGNKPTNAHTRIRRRIHMAKPGPVPKVFVYGPRTRFA